MRPRKYHVTLTHEEHQELLDLTKKGTVSAQKIRHAQILLKLDENFNEKPWSVQEICDGVAQRFVENGLESALNRKKQENRHRKITGDVEAHIIAIACSDAPEGRDRWTLQLIADRLVELKIVESISSTAIGTTLKKTNSNRGS